MSEKRSKKEKPASTSGEVEKKSRDKKDSKRDKKDKKEKKEKKDRKRDDVRLTPRTDQSGLGAGCGVVKAEAARPDCPLALTPEAGSLNRFRTAAQIWFLNLMTKFRFVLFYVEELALSASAGVIEIAQATFDFNARSDAELTFTKDDYIEILKKTETVGWWKGRKRGTNQTGLFPSNYCEVVHTVNASDVIRTTAGSLKMSPAAQAAFLEKAKSVAEAKSKNENTVKNDKNRKNKEKTSKSAVLIATVLFDFDARKAEELGVQRGDEILVIEKGTKGGWWKGASADGREGLFPSNYCQMAEKDKKYWDRQVAFAKRGKKGNAADALKEKMKAIDEKWSSVSTEEVAKKNKKEKKSRKQSSSSKSASQEDASVSESTLIGQLRGELAEKAREIVILKEKLALAEELIENLDALVEKGPKTGKKKDKYMARQSSKY